MKTAFWRDISYFCGISALLMSLFQLTGWINVHPDANAEFTLIVMFGAAAACTGGLFLDRTNVPFWLLFICQIVVCSLIDVGLSVALVHAVPTVQFVSAIAVCAALVAAAAAALNKLEASTWADSINRGIELRRRDDDPGQ